MTPRLLALALFAALLARPAAAAIFDPKTFTLANGMRVVVVESHRAPVVTHMVWYKVGRADEPPGKGGLSHFLEHLMFKGTPTHGPNEMSRLIARNGGRENAFTSYDYTAYYQTVAADRLELMMRLEADRMANLTLADAVIEPERQVVSEERHMRTGNDPASRLREFVRAALFVNHPYGQPVIGWEAEIAGWTLDDVMGHYRRWYCPGNAVLVVAGDITVERLRPLAEAIYGPLACAASPPARVRPPTPALAVESRITLRDPGVGQPAWSRNFLAPSLGTDPETALALEVLDEALSGGATARLYKALVIDRQLAATFATSYDDEAIDGTAFSVSAEPRAGVTIDTLEAAVVEEIGRLLDEGLSDDDVARARQRLLDSAVFARDSIETAAEAFGSALTTGRTVADVEQWPDRIAAVTADRVNAALRRVLGAPGHVTALLLPEREKAK